MESEGLKKFLAIVGDAVHSVNTTCVGLSAVSSGDAKKPDDLTISWSSSDPVTAASKARLFVLRASLIFVEEALLKYLDFLQTTSHDNKLSKALNSEGAAERVIEISKLLTQAESYWWPIVVLLVRWRNKVVHNSRTDLTNYQRNILLKYSETLKEKHAGIDISKTLENFENNQITLKDFTTLIAITVRFVRALDEELEPQIHTLEGFRLRLRQRGLISTFNKTLNANGESTKCRKLRAFLKSEFSNLPEMLIEEIYKNGPIPQSCT